MVAPGSDLDHAKPSLIGERLAEMALQDFAEFFLPGYELVIPLTVGDSSSHASAKSRGQERWIAISRDMAQHEISDPATFLFHVLIVGHEIAHVVHEHVFAGEQDAKDHSALEFWADFYGAKVTMTLITFGDRICESLAAFVEHADEGKTRLAFLGEAVDMMIAGGVYDTHPRYPQPLVRAGLISNGVTSFLRQNMGDSFSPDMYVSIFSAIMGGPSTQDLIRSDAFKTDYSFEPIERLQQWHRRIQGDRVAITSHFRLNLLPYLHTTFDQSEDERVISKARRLKELQEAGFLPGVTLDDL
ncbi:hypothetical protein [Aurantiacibacter zhengii]|uniref:Uncharacterized protein n=1 Tax=Aurantiacibacter zhengii TaxID=2307003 RepID=A0A418NMI5_9SPHN|nr:hypothetical protein [Aurantiacibacter zhengii]RIV82185.1 hypothetical protein D2V07_18245 [Aurantiacibacter zhengii]